MSGALQVVYMNQRSFVPPVAYFIGLLGDSAVDEGYGVAVDSAGGVYVCGQSLNSGTTDVQLAKYNASGVIQWQRRLGASGTTSRGRKVAIDSSDNIYVTGFNTDGTGTYLSLAKYNSSGTIQFQKKLGGASGENDRGLGITIDSSNNIYVTGTSKGTVGFAGVFIAKYNSSGAVQWQRTLSNVLGDQGNFLDTDSSGNVYICGQGVNFGESNNIILAKYNSSGTIQWQRKLLGTNSETALGIVVDSSGNSYITGTSNNSGTFDIQILKYNSSGTIQFQRLLGRTGQTDGQSIILDSSNNFYVLGSSLISSIFRFQIAKYNSSGTIQWQRKLGSTSGNTNGFSIAVDSSDNIYAFGQTGVSGTTDFIIAKLPNDGSLTGTYSVGAYSFVYEASTLTDDASSLTDSAATFTDLASSLPEATTSLTDAASTLTSSVTTL
jgi:uncharacterized delta-60 repeat protein